MPMEPSLRILLEQTNPWLRDPTSFRAAAERRLPPTYIPRAIEDEVGRSLEDTRRAHMVIGPRQTGKSTLIWALLARAPTPLLFLNCEEPLIREWCRSPGLFAADLSDWLPPQGTVFFEEAQWLEEAGLFFKGLVDACTERRVVVTGSASFHLLARTRESLAGRATRHELWPLGLREIVLPDSRPAAVRRGALRQTMERMLRFGSYPAAWTASDPPRVLFDLMTAFVLRDASDRFRIERPDALRLLLRLAAGQVGDVVNYSEWSRILGIAVSTTTDYARLLEETHVLSFVRPFIGGKRAELTQAPKVFFLDVGLRNAIGGGFAPLVERMDVGKLLECWVFSELHKRFPAPGAVRYWRTRGGGEVDFVIEPAPGRLVAIEVKATAGARPPLSRSLQSFVAAYAPAEVWLVHRGEAAEQSLGATRVRWLPAELLPDVVASVVDGGE